MHAWMHVCTEARKHECMNSHTHARTHTHTHTQTDSEEYSSKNATLQMFIDRWRDSVVFYCKSIKMLETSYLSCTLWNIFGSGHALPPHHASRPFQ